MLTKSYVKEWLNAFVSDCGKIMVNQTQQLNQKLFEDILGTHKEHEHQIDQQKIDQNQDIEENTLQKPYSHEAEEKQTEDLPQVIPSELQQKNQPQSLSIITFIKPEPTSFTQQILQKAIQNEQIPIDQTQIVIKKQPKLKQNPRMHKFIKHEKLLQKSREKQLLEKIALQKQLQQRARELQELKEKQIKKFGLKEKLRKLNQQLDIEKKMFQSKEKDKLQASFFNNSNQNQQFDDADNSRFNMMNPQNSLIKKHKISTTFIKDPAIFQSNQLKSKSDAEFKVRKLKQQEEVYSPVKHEAAFKLIEKMHAQKLKKQEKIVSEMRKKQQKEIEQVKRLEQEKMKEKQLKMVRQVLYYTPKQTKLKKLDQSEYLNEKELRRREFSMDVNPEANDLGNRKKGIFRAEQKKGLKEEARNKEGSSIKINEMEEDIGLVIPQEKINIEKEKRKHETLYTEEYEDQPFVPETQQGKELAEALQSESQQMGLQNEFI